MQVGFIGAGTLTAAIVAGLRRERGTDTMIRLSPRSEQVSRTLAARFDQVVREESNAAVAANSEVVVLAVRPQQVEEAVADLRIGRDQVVLSVVAGLPLAEIARKFPEADRICRAVPLPAIALSKGPIAIFPAMPPVLHLFEGLGDVIRAADERELNLLTYAGGLMSMHFELQETVTAWLTARGAGRANASSFVASMFAGLAETAMRTPPERRAALAQEHETKRGLNERARRMLQAEDWFGQLWQALMTLESQTDLKARPIAAHEPATSEVATGVKQKS